MGLVLLRTLHDGVIRLSSGTKRYNITLKHARVKFPKPLVTFGRPHTPNQPGLILSPDAPLSVTWFSQVPGPDAPTTSIGGIIAVILEPVTKAET